MLVETSFTTPATVSSTGAALVTSTLLATAEPGAPVYSTFTSSPRLTFMSVTLVVSRAKSVPSARVTMILLRDASFTTPSTMEGAGVGSETETGSGALTGDSGAGAVLQPANRVSIIDRTMSIANSFFIVCVSSLLFNRSMYR